MNPIIHTYHMNPDIKGLVGKLLKPHIENYSKLVSISYSQLYEDLMKTYIDFQEKEIDEELDMFISYKKFNHTKDKETIEKLEKQIELTDNYEKDILLERLIDLKTTLRDETNEINEKKNDIKTNLDYSKNSREKYIKNYIKNILIHSNGYIVLFEKDSYKLQETPQDIKNNKISFDREKYLVLKHDWEEKQRYYKHHKKNNIFNLDYDMKCLCEELVKGYNSEELTIIISMNELTKLYNKVNGTNITRINNLTQRSADFIKEKKEKYRRLWEFNKVWYECFVNKLSNDIKAMDNSLKSLKPNLDDYIDYEKTLILQVREENRKLNERVKLLTELVGNKVAEEAIMQKQLLDKDIQIANLKSQLEKIKNY